MDEVAYAAAMQAKPRGWLPDQVRQLLEEVTVRRAVTNPVLIDLPDQQEVVTVVDQTHRFRRGKIVSTTFVAGNPVNTFECACGCGEVAQQT